MTGFLETYLGKLVATAAMSMLPVVELRGGIPYGTGPTSRAGWCRSTAWRGW